MDKLNQKTVALIATNGFEDQELRSPKLALEEAGAKVDVLSLELGHIRGWKDKDWGDSVEVTRVVSSANAHEYDALVLPGGVINADALRGTRDVVRLVGEFFEANKPIAAICHAPWLLIEAGKLEGRRVTSYFSLKTDLKNAGAHWVDEAAVEDDNLLTSRTPKDLMHFNEKMIHLFASWVPKVQAAASEPDADVGTEMAGEVSREDELDRLAKLREDGESPAPKVRRVQALERPTAPRASRPGDELDTGELEGSAQTRGMGSKGRKFVGSSRHRRPSDAGESEGSTRRGSAARKKPEASRGTSTKFAARTKTPKRKPTRK